MREERGVRSQFLGGGGGGGGGNTQDLTWLICPRMLGWTWL